MALTQQNIRQLRGLAHKLKPVIILGKAGFSESVLSELELALTHHELVKIKLNEADKKRQRMVPYSSTMSPSHFLKVCLYFLPLSSAVLLFSH